MSRHSLAAGRPAAIGFRAQRPILNQSRGGFFDFNGVSGTIEMGHVSGFAASEYSLDRAWRRVDGVRLAGRRHHHGDYDHRPALGAGGVQYRGLHAVSIRFTAVSRDLYTGQQDIGTGPLGVIGNIIWLVLAGWWLALAHVVTAIVLAVTIIGIPFAWAHLKLAGIALWPIGKIIVPA